MARKHHVQLELPRFDKNGQRRGVHHAHRSGRPRKGERAGAPRKRRPDHDRAHPVHVTLRVVGDVPWLRTAKAYRAIRRALATTARHAETFRVVHISVQSNHVHALCEASDKLALASGLQGFQISAARHVNRAHGRRGQVFADRYHAVAIDSVRGACQALSYVLNNWRKHRRSGTGLFGGRLDPYASGVAFPGWRESLPRIALPAAYEPPPVSAPRTWLLATGYQLGPPVSVFAVPGGQRGPAKPEKDSARGR